MQVQLFNLKSASVLSLNPGRSWAAIPNAHAPSRLGVTAEWGQIHCNLSANSANRVLRKLTTESGSTFRPRRIGKSRPLPRPMTVPLRIGYGEPWKRICGRSKPPELLSGQDVADDSEADSRKARYRTASQSWMHGPPKPGLSRVHSPAAPPDRRHKM
jgi:hypothetical protein